jgi:crotonobetainyl-CoA:carnitine CoA-transferase CaiB-like acyl-CoA transferase
LSGIKALEPGNILAGPFCGMLPGDKGAAIRKLIDDKVVEAAAEA